VLFVALACIGIAAVVKYQQMGMLQKPQAATTTSIVEPSPALIPIKINSTSGPKFSLKTQSSNLTVGSNITIHIIADSKGQKVLGYDVLVGIKKTEYDLVSVKSLLTEFSTMKFVKDDHLTVTSIQKPSVSQSIEFQNIPIAEIVLKPKQKGVLNLAILLTKGAEITKIMTSSADTAIKVPAVGSSAANLQLDIK